MTEREFVKKIGQLATEDMKKSGILASITTAQAILESGYGSTDLAVNANNLFGMKKELSGNSWTGSAWDGVSVYRKRTAEQDVNGNEYYVYADFRKYAYIADSIADHSAYLCGAKKGTDLRYAGIATERNYRAAAQIIKSGGYATDINYVSKLCNIIERWDLTKFDTGVEREMKIYISPSDQTGNKYSYGGTNEAVVCRKISKAAKKALERNGYTVKVGADGTTYQQRVSESNNWGANVHMPIHTNAGGGDGTVVFAYPTSLNNKYVRAVYDAVAALSPGKDDGIRAMRNLYEINNSSAVCVYLECEFHDDSELAKWIIEHTEEIGEAIAKGFCKADGKKYKSEGGTSQQPEAKIKYYVQSGAYSEYENAVKQVKKLKEAGFDAIIKEA